MKKCQICGEKIEKKYFCENCLNSCENINEKIYRKINEIYSSLSLVFYPIVCFSIIYQIKNFKDFINSIDFYILVLLIISTISSWYRLVYEQKNKKILQQQYKSIKSKLKNQ